ncbi:hypothetical protein PHSY_005987 [Pseudozyma hubeiensis SY62]|uniref:AMP-dependent synthetase/ligase domain-containing protein n=1 Tax=Pseudozyma hubeiensis (strain SY62) TaxID=1305764 RepID=R9PAI0_PSEHS|nr:hypothetical protein PHSY_005987 [Pseudozyma hubeiensis SY62]GAC98393.1 hypothetical protein PHSY_005987 [Pseudozyma hubeiensis SY62]
MSDCFGLVLGNLAAWTHGASVVYAAEGFDPLRSLRAVSEERCTAMHGVPTHFISELELLESAREHAQDPARHPLPQGMQEGETFDFSSLRTGLTSGSTVPIALMEALVSPDVDAPIVRRCETVGRVYPHVHAKIVSPDDSSGQPLPVGQPGELCGYWKDPQRTDEAMERHPDEPDIVWMRTGDIGIMDEEGYVRIVGRSKDVIIRGGENLFPPNIENCIDRMEGIATNAVIAVPDEKYGEPWKEDEVSVYYPQNDGTVYTFLLTDSFTSGLGVDCCTVKMFGRIYDNGAVNVRKQDADAQLAVKRTSPSFPVAISGGDVTLYHDLVVLFATQWDVDAGSFGTAGNPSGSGYQQQTFAIDILKMIVDSLVVKSLPFGQRLQVISTSRDGFQLPCPTITRADKFQHYTQARVRAYAEDELLRHAQLHDLAFNSHPFLSLIVCRTIFVGDVEEKAHDKLLYDAVLIAGLGIKRSLAQNLWYAQTQPHGLPDLDKLVKTTTCTLYGSKLGSLKAASLHKFAQCMMILAWHELTLGLLRRAATWWTSVCGLILRIRDLREQEEIAAEFQINGIHMHLVIREELDNMQTIAQLVLLWLELHLAPIPANTSILVDANISQPQENSFSWISELDHASGKFSAAEAHKKSWTLLCSISRVLGSLAESVTDFKITNRLIDTRMLPGTANDDATFKVFTTLPLARATQADPGAAASAGDFMAAALISLTGLLACFHAGSTSTSVSAQGVANIVRACAAITLQLRSAFGDPQPQFGPDRASDSIAICRPSVSASCFVDTLDGSCIVLTVIETIALSFEHLLTQANIRLASDSEGSREAIILSQEAQRTVREKLGSILGIISTITEFFDNIPKQGKRPVQMSRMLGRMQDQIEMLGVQPDVSFAFDVAFGQSEYEAWRGGDLDLKRDSVLQMRPHEIVSHPSTALATGLSRSEGMAQCPSYLTVGPQLPMSLHIAPPASPYDHPNTANPEKRPIIHGPGPITTTRHEPPEVLGPLPRAAHEVEGFTVKNDCSVMLGQATHAWRQQSYSEDSTAMVSSSHGEAQVNFDDKSRRCTMQTAPFGESMLRQTQPESMEKTYLRQLQPQPQPWSTGGAYSSTVLGFRPAYAGLEPSLRPAAQSMPVSRCSGRSEVHRLAAESFYQGSGSGSSIDERPNKRARIDLPGCDWTSSINKTRLLYLDEATSSTNPFLRSTAHIHGHHSPAMAALVSIKGVQPLTDETYLGGRTSAQSSELEGDGTSNGRLSMDSESSLSSLSDDEDDDEDKSGDGVDEYGEEDRDRDRF